MKAPYRALAKAIRPHGLRLVQHRGHLGVTDGAGHYLCSCSCTPGDGFVAGAATVTRLIRLGRLPRDVKRPGR